MANTHFPWVCLTHGDTPVYFSKESPNWFVPNRKADEILRSLALGASVDGNLRAIQLMSRLPEAPNLEYSGRSSSLSLERIAELWFHLTNRCNMACGHCLFSSSPTDSSELSTRRVLEIADQARSAGCGLFALTGGEPLVHPGIDEIVEKLLGYEKAHVVMLTNGLTVKSFLQRMRPDPERFHLQISLDGLGDTHESLRGKGAFEKLSESLQWLKSEGYPYTLSMCVTSSNVKQMPGIVDFAADMGASNVHYMWYFVRGRGKQSGFATVDDIFENLMKSSIRAEECGIPVDNIEAMKTQIFAPAGTIHDGGTAGWESLAVGPDEKLYPSAALVGVEELASDMGSGLVETWRLSPVLERIRNSTVVTESDSPLRFILGGGDIDHSYLHAKKFLGDDPYEKLYEKTALWLVSREAQKQRHNGEPGLLLQMGETLKSCGAHGKVALVHSNCLLATAQNDSLTTVKEFYSDAVADTKTDILNPVCYETSLIDHIPEKYRFRGYGCGSPILDAKIRQGETVVDLGCGGGVECFVASRLTGSKGRAVGIDMLDPMLNLAREAKPLVAENLGYDNIEFKKGYLEDLPMEDDSADVTVSNCVMNLSVDKRKAYAEIFRILRPGGRLVISDVVCDTEPDPAIRNDEALKGECIAGALTASHLVALLEETGFEATTLVKRFPYRKVDGHPFFSLTFSAVKPEVSEPVDVIYRGPLPFLMTQKGILLQKGDVVRLDRNEADRLGDQVFVLEEGGYVVNIEAENTCACFVAPEEKTAPKPTAKLVVLGTTTASAHARETVGCMVCGSPLVYKREPRDRQCEFCGMVFSSNSGCEKGHFVCDQCHVQDAVEAIRHICFQTRETDMVRLFERIRSHPTVALHGPEYHAMIPGIVLCTYRNLGGSISDQLIETGISRGKGVAGGFCGFMGVCGAVIGVGIAFSLILDANPVKAAERSAVQDVTQTVLSQIAKLKAARCCQRDGYIALTEAAELSKRLLPVALKAEYKLICRQVHLNKECLGKECLLHPTKVRRS